jgi:hypothetical protein
VPNSWPAQVLVDFNYFTKIDGHQMYSAFDCTGTLITRDLSILR